MNKIILMLIAGLLSNISIAAVAADAAVPYPEGYRNWLHVKSMLIQPGHALANPFQGLHHVYANKSAEKGLKNGQYANGSVLVFDLLQYQDKDNTIQEGERKLIGVMVKNDKKYAATGGWGFEGFAGNSKTKRLTDDGGKSCFSCHAPEKKNDYVYSKYRQ
jgi:Cytochrome P460